MQLYIKEFQLFIVRVHGSNGFAKKAQAHSVLFDHSRDIYDFYSYENLVSY